MAHLTRKEMKRDEVREGMIVAYEWIADNGKKILAVLGGLVVLAGIVALVLVFLNVREKRGHEALADALKIYRAPINSEGADPDHPTDPSFPDAAARRARARVLLEEVLAERGSTSAGRISNVYLGEIAAMDGDVAAARGHWEGFLAKADDHALSASVRLNLLSLDRGEGRAAEVAEELRRSVDEGTGPIPIDAMLYELGRTLEMQGSDDEARETYQQLVDEYPNSQYSTLARQRLGPAAA